MSRANVSAGCYRSLRPPRHVAWWEAVILPPLARQVALTKDVLAWGHVTPCRRVLSVSSSLSSSSRAVDVPPALKSQERPCRRTSRPRDPTANLVLTAGKDSARFDVHERNSTTFWPKKSIGPGVPVTRRSAQYHAVSSPPLTQRSKHLPYRRPPGSRTSPSVPYNGLVSCPDLGVSVPALSS